MKKYRLKLFCHFRKFHCSEIGMTEVQGGILTLVVAFLDILARKEKERQKNPLDFSLRSYRF